MTTTALADVQAETPLPACVGSWMLYRRKWAEGGVAVPVLLRNSDGSRGIVTVWPAGINGSVAVYQTEHDGVVCGTVDSLEPPAAHVARLVATRGFVDVTPAIPAE